MRHRRWMICGLLAAVLTLAVGCECEPESDGELCGERQCGRLSMVDNCGDERVVDCGSCAAYRDCENHRCVCDGESPQQLCGQLDADCGRTTLIDGCRTVRTVDCGSCPPAGECIDRQCVCDGQTDEMLCEIDGVECGSADLVDDCGIVRRVDCGGCDRLEECVDQSCVCVGESDEELCEQLEEEGACGEREVTDTCGEQRIVDCRPCVEGDTTFGVVRNAETGEPVDDALIRIWEWPPDQTADKHWSWPSGFRADDPDFAITTGSMGAMEDADINYEFSAGEPLCLQGQSTGGLAAHQWYRIRVDRPGYEPVLTYWRHPGWTGDQCPTQCPASEQTGCHRRDFEIWPQDSDRTLLPNLFVDRRDLRDYQWQCALLPDDADYDRLIGFRVRLGANNAGPGPFHLEGAAGDDGEGVVYQHIHNSDGDVERRVVDSDVFDYSPPSQPRMVVWARLRLVDPVDECRDIDGRDDACVLRADDKLSFCLHDTEPFDEEGREEYGGVDSRFPNPPTCDRYEHGITPGWKDVYRRELPGQGMAIGPPAEVSGLGKLWIEVEIDPRHVLADADRTTNVGRLTVEAPEDATSICDDPDAVLDCTVSPEQYDRDQRWQCPDYLEY